MNLAVVIAALPFVATRDQNSSAPAISAVAGLVNPDSFDKQQMQPHPFAQYYLQQIQAQHLHIIRLFEHSFVAAPAANCSGRRRAACRLRRR
ncbi:MAG: hypothetical protein K9G83_07055 [Hyphomonadaceae bacterium]|nr:hypothetical protein [Hyphomonadaceae bacterium]